MKAFSEDSKKSNGSGVVAIDDLKKDEIPMSSENAMTNGSDRVSVGEFKMHFLRIIISKNSKDFYVFSQRN